MPQYSQLTVFRGTADVWTVTFSNPPINMLAETTIEELLDLLDEADDEPALKVIVFRSANPEFFIAHYDTGKSALASSASKDYGDSPWQDFVLRLASAPYVSIAEVTGRVRGVGNEFVLACDMRFAAHSAILANPEIGVGLSPGGGALEWLPRLVGRSRTLEIVLSGDDFNAQLAERYGWINRAVPDADLDEVVERLAARLASFDREMLASIKAQVNRYGVPGAAELYSSRDHFRDAMAGSCARARFAKAGGMGFGQPGELERNLGRLLPSLAPDAR
jgi:enoyl-CoA hydratase/carnithine racemase